MPSHHATYKKLIRLREKRKRLDRRISILASKLDRTKDRWGSCAYYKNKK